MAIESVSIRSRGGNPFLSSSSSSAAAEASNNNQPHSMPPQPRGKWNPFEDSKSFGELSEEALFGEQFDKIRNQVRLGAHSE